MGRRSPTCWRAIGLEVERRRSSDLDLDQCQKAIPLLWYDLDRLVASLYWCESSNLIGFNMVLQNPAMNHTLHVVSAAFVLEECPP
jgi:hypothetical protein